MTKCSYCLCWFNELAGHICNKNSLVPAKISSYVDCNHCYCILSKNQVTAIPHRKCCKCHDIMAEKFLFKPDIGFKQSEDL